jgi:UDP-N-acetylglucosamine acyltransferase
MPGVHPSAIVSPRADLATDVEVGPHAVIEPGVRIGGATRIGPGAVVLSGTTLGEGNAVHAYAVLGDTPQDTHFSGGETFLVIGDRNVIREFVTVHRGTEAGSTTRIGSGCMLMACSHVAHNCVVADGAVLTNGALLGGHVEVGEAAFISGNAVVHQFTRVGRLAMIAGNARATEDVPPFAIVSGSNVLSGMNRVGLRRAGLSGEVVSAIGRAYRRIFLSGRAPDEAARGILAEDAPPEARELAGFVLASKRGVCRPRRKRAPGPAGPSEEPT